MYMDKCKKIGVVGLNPRAVAQAAKSLGFTVYLADYYADVDTENSVDMIFSLQKDPKQPDKAEEYTPSRLVDFAIEKLEGKVDFLLPTSGVGCTPELVRKLEKHFDVIGNGWKAVRKVKNWNGLKKTLDSLGIQYPDTIVARSSKFKGIRKAVEKLDYPVVVKPVLKGIHLELIRGDDDLKLYLDHLNLDDRELLIQRYIKGTDISSSVLGGSGSATAISVNRQLTGFQEFGVRTELTYCGHLVPLDYVGNKEIEALSEEIISRYGLLGSNGVDYVISNDEIYFMEINPRFQDTIECVGKYRGLNLVEEHISAIDGDLKRPEFKSDKCFGKAIIFADEKIRVSGLSTAKNIADIPPDNTIIQPHEPVCSVFAEGENNRDVLEGLIRQSYAIQRSLR